MAQLDGTSEGLGLIKFPTRISMNISVILVAGTQTQHTDVAPSFIRQAQIASPALIAFVEPKRGADPAVLKHFTAYHSIALARKDWQRRVAFRLFLARMVGLRCTCTIGLLSDLTTAQFPEVVAIEFD